jgi:hypothetical protein
VTTLPAGTQPRQQLCDGIPIVSPRGVAVSATDALFVADTGNHRICAVYDDGGMAALAGGDPDGLEAPARQLLIAPRENRLLAADGKRLAAWTLNAGYPEVSWRSLFGRVWYEKYPGHVHAWETTGHESFESKFGLVPLIFGTLKATLYSMLFATPIAILAAIFASQFMHPRWKARIKPIIEMMASLPSVVLGFMAGLVFSPVIERGLMPLITGFFVMPVAILLAAHLWQLIPSGWRTRHPGWRLVAIAGGAVPGHSGSGAKDGSWTAPTNPSMAMSRLSTIVPRVAPRTTPVTGVTVNSFRLLLNGRSVSLRGASVTGSGTTYTLILPPRRTTPRGIYTLEVVGDGSIKAVANGAPMTKSTLFYWGRGQSVGPRVNARLMAFASLR